MTSYHKWLFYAPLGLILVGMGVCFAIESAFLKHSGADTITWVTYGTLSMIVLNSGLCFFGSAILARIRYDRNKT